jgi:hypothetical protein
VGIAGEFPDEHGATLLIDGCLLTVELFLFEGLHALLGSSVYLQREFVMMGHVRILLVDSLHSRLI